MTETIIDEEHVLIGADLIGAAAPEQLEMAGLSGGCHGKNGSDGARTRGEDSVSAALIDGKQLGEGAGRTKKDAEQEAARQALESLEAEAA